jgi:ATP synthase protein I
MNDEEKYSRFTKYYKDVGPYLGTGVQLAAIVVLMFFLGRWIDSQAGTDPVFTLIFAVFGIAAGLFNFIKTVLSLSKTEDDKKK